MDLYEATRIMLSRIQSLDPENASKIMGYLLIQDHGEKEMIRLAFGPEAHIHSLILEAKTRLGLSTSNPPTPSTPHSPLFSSKPTPLSIPSSPSTTSWSTSIPNSNLSYSSVVNRSSAIANGDDNEFIDNYQFHDHLSFLNDSKPEDLFSPRLDLAMPDSLLHRRSFSVTGLCFGAADDVNSGIGWKPCLYFARGFCKNGTSCRFLHEDCVDGGAALVGSPSKFNELEQYQELLRSKSFQQQQQNLASASQFMSGTSFPYGKDLNLLLQQQNDNHNSYGRSAMAALMMGDELHKLGRCRPERNDYSAMGLGAAANPCSRQIYLTFPADSSFKEEDVSNYFSIYGPVQDVRIPYQQKRMFGFVTFVYPETVRLILAKGNPHFICDSRVLVKPYKEKGKVQEKKQLERGEYSACSSPSAIDSREPFDLHLGSKMFYNTPEMLMRRKLEEQADLQQAIELQGRRLMNLQLLDLKNQHQSPFRHDLSTGSPIPSPTVPRTPNNHALIFPADGINQEVPEEKGGCAISAVSKLAAATKDDKQMEDINAVCNYKNDSGNSNTKAKANTEESDLPDCLELVLPDNLFTSPKKSAGDHLAVFSTSSAVDVEADNKTGTPTTSCSNGNASGLNMASLKTYLLQMPRFSSGQGTVGM
ncbi:zinc finger CCCH domain-containing protein 53-like [Hibiscus syriacus]|uniref:zinc finger CCCH domain-containing protein 53-like n=1 Tax=Hibiscus syriacus TaxID=106335 RepID=UPI001924DC38|nr:zinc finger CCCH domain-containing protein 53-like [Hibiscus syriacus]